MDTLYFYRALRKLVKNIVFINLWRAETSLCFFLDLLSVNITLKLLSKEIYYQ